LQRERNVKLPKFFYSDDLYSLCNDS
jgi:hypothetical protein